MKSSPARVASIKSQQGRPDRHLDPKIIPQVYLCPIEINCTAKLNDLPYPIVRQLPRSAVAFLQQVPSPAIIVKLNLAFSLLRRHLEKVLLCCHSFDVCHLVDSPTIANVRGYGVDMDLC